MCKFTSGFVLLGGHTPWTPEGGSSGYDFQERNFISGIHPASECQMGRCTSTGSLSE